MARGLNKVMLIGNLGADPEIKYTPGGTAIANFTLATADRKKNKDGDWEDYTEWHRIVMFGRQAELCKDYLRKGSKTYIEGRLQTRSWEDQSGQKKYMTEIVGNIMLLLDPKQSDSSGPSGGSHSSRGRSSGGDPFPDSGSQDTGQYDDLPF